MARSYTLRSQMKTRLAATVEGLSADQIIVERRKGLNEMIAGATAAFENGVAVTILPADGRVIDPDNETLLTDLEVVVSMWCSPVIAGLDTQPEEDIHEGILEALHHWVAAVQDQPARAAYHKLKVTGWREVDDPDYLRRDTTVVAELMM